MSPQTRLALRGVQFGLSLGALVLIAASFKSHTIESSYFDLSITEALGSPETTFGMLMAFVTMLYALWSLLAVEIYHYAVRPSAPTERYMDGAAAVVLLVSGIVLASSDYVVQCEWLEGGLRCGTLTVGVVLTFLAMTAFLATFGLNYRSRSAAADVEEQGDHHVPYLGEATPTDAATRV